jgi:hypothetical protein
MTLVERLRAEAEQEMCVPLTPLLRAAADQIERLEAQLLEARRKVGRDA